MRFLQTLCRSRTVTGQLITNTNIQLRSIASCSSCGRYAEHFQDDASSWRNIALAASVILAATASTEHAGTADAESPVFPSKSEDEASTDVKRKDKFDSSRMDRNAVPDVIERVNDSVVYIKTDTKAAFVNPKRLFRNRREAQELIETAGASGFFFDERGLILTNFHCVMEAMAGVGEIEIMTRDGRWIKGLVVAADPGLDVAIVKIKDGNQKFPPLKFADSDTVRIGEPVIALQCPLGSAFVHTVSTGVVSGKERELHKITAQFSYGETTGYEHLGNHYLQTDASLNPGSSGSPLLNMDGEVIGMNSISLSGFMNADGMGFAIPSNLLMSSVGELMEFGKTRKPVIGLTLIALTSIAIAATEFGYRSNNAYMEKLKELTNNGLYKEVGLLIHNVAEDTPAAQAGLKEGDVVLDVDGVRTTKVSRFIAETRFKAGKSVTLRVLRTSGAVEDITFELGAEQLSPAYRPLRGQQLIIDA